MTPCKVQKCCSTQKSVKDVSSSALCGKRADPLDMIPDDDHLQRHIFSFLLAKPVPPLNPKTLKEEERPYDEFCDHHHNISLVSKQRTTILGDSFNESAPPEILTPRQLAELKSKVYSLDLSTECVHKNFVNLVKMKWPPRLREDDILGPDVIDPLKTVMERFKPAVFIKMVEDEYKRFLVLKCVQNLVVENGVHDNDAVSQWLEPIEPSPLVDLFWQSHILDVKKYSKDCHFLVGNVFEYIEPCDDTNEASSSLPDNHKNVFCFEQSFRKHSILKCLWSCRVPAEEKYASIIVRNKLFGLDTDMEKLHDEIRE